VALWDFHCERKTTDFRSYKIKLLSAIKWRPSVVRFRGVFPLSFSGVFREPSRADPEVCGNLSQTIDLCLQLHNPFALYAHSAANSNADIVSRSGGSGLSNTPTYPATFFACFLTFAHRFFAAFANAALPAADKTRFFTLFISWSA
jgi:hypothetical protein